jgi:large subunit ribosomal protein L13
VNSGVFGRAKRFVNQRFLRSLDLQPGLDSRMWVYVRTLINKLNCFLVVKLKMNTLSYKTISVNKETAKKEWVVIDATDQVVGRLASKVAKLIRGKYKPTFTPHVDCGDNVILINADKVVFTGKKETDKVYTRYTGYPGGQRFQTPAELRKREGGVEKFLRHAVKGMLPKGPLGRSLLNNLYIYEGTEHPHEAQKPKAIDINQYK